MLYITSMRNVKKLNSETKSRVVVSRGWRVREMGRDWSEGYKLLVIR